uniref:Beta-catenin-like protein 1 n=1 Tax=Romanomermis culicivorax TaxID=13658 RepID=A0A915LCG8_ROMCU
MPRSIRISFEKSAQVSDRRRSARDENLEPFAKLSRLEANGGNIDASELLKSADDVDVEPVDEKNVRKMVSMFEKRALKNQEMRVKFSDQPDKFMDSEVELNVAIQELHALSTAPQYYHLLVDANIIQHFLYTLNHENTDISCAVVHLLQELTDIDMLTESKEAADKISGWIVNDGQIIGALIKNLERLDEVANKDEADGVYNTLAVIENVFEFESEELVLHLVRLGFLAWILKRLKAKIPFDANALYCSELLSVLLQNSDVCKKSLGQELDGVDILLQQLASFKRHNPKDQDEIEYMENMFDSLCACLMHTDNLRKFLDGEGLQLMNLMLREKKMSRSSALKVLDYAMNSKAAKDNCDKFVDILGLRTLFPLFMKTPAKHKRKGHTAEEHEEHVCAIIASLLKYCSTAQQQRVLSKFTESDCEKVERLIELHFKYLERVKRFEINYERRRPAEIYDEETEDEKYLKKLDAGLFTLHLIDYIMAEIYVNGPAVLKERISKILNIKKSSITVVREVLERYGENLDDKSHEKISLINLLTKMVD